MPAFTFVSKNSVGGTGDSITVTLPNVAVGDLIVLNISWDNGGSGSPVSSVSDGSSSVWATPGKYTYYNVYGQLYYCLNSQASGTVTYTITLPSDATFPSVDAMCYSYTGIITVDSGFWSSSHGEGDNSTPTSASFSTTGTTELVFACVVATGSVTYSSPTIGGSAANELAQAYDSSGEQGSALFSLIGTVSSGDVLVTLSGSEYWAINAFGFYLTAAAVPTGWLPPPDSQYIDRLEIIGY